MAFVISEPCIGVKDKACLPVCPCDCIHEGEQMLYIDPEACIDCQACADVCPTQAIFQQDELPEKWKYFREINARFFPEQDEAKAWEGHDVPGKSVA